MLFTCPAGTVSPFTQSQNIKGLFHAGRGSWQRIQIFVASFFSSLIWKKRFSFPMVSSKVHTSLDLTGDASAVVLKWNQTVKHWANLGWKPWRWSVHFTFLFKAGFTACPLSRLNITQSITPLIYIGHLCKMENILQICAWTAWQADPPYCLPKPPE